MHTIFHVIVDIGLMYSITHTFLNYAAVVTFLEEMKLDEQYYVVVPSVVDQPTYDKIRRLKC